MQETAVLTSYLSLTRKFLSGVCLAGLLACQSTSLPVEEHVLARAAMDAARAVESARYSPGHWHQAEEAYRRAQVFVKERDFEKARVEFVKARTSAEKAENSARVIRQRNGEIL